MEFVSTHYSVFFNSQFSIFNLIVSLHIRNLLLQILHLLFLQHFLVLDRDYLDKLVYVVRPVIE